MSIAADRLPVSYGPAYHEALGRLAGKRDPDWLTARLNTLLLGIPRLVG